jgi:hypothetical protein
MRGLYVTEGSGLVIRARAGLALAGPAAVVCGATGLALAGVDLPQRLTGDERIWLRVPPDQRWPDRPEVRLVRSLQSAPSCLVQGLPTLSLAHCWVQLATVADLDDMVRLADGLTRRRHPITTIEALRRALDNLGPARGVRLARSALELARPGTDSPPETDLRLLLVRAGLPAPTVNLPIRDVTGRVIYWLDLGYDWALVAIEYDGAIHVGNREQMEADIVRRRRLEDLGWRIITVSRADLAHRRSDVVRSVRDALAHRGGA